MKKMKRDESIQYELYARHHEYNTGSPNFDSIKNMPIDQ